MRGELDDALDRMARREELQRRLAAERPVSEHNPADDVAEAVRRVVAHHPNMVVRLWVQNGSTTTPMRVAWSGGAVTVTPEDRPAPVSGSVPAWPVRTHPVANRTAPAEPANEPAAQLADLIRRNPSFLDGSR